MDTPRRVPALVCAAFAVLLAVWPTAATAKPVGSRIDDAVAEHLAATGTPGAAMAVLGGGETIHTQVWGEDGNGAEVSADTPFLWGSVAKPVTSLLAMRLAESGDLDIDDPAGEYLDWFRPTWRGEPAPVTIAQLLANTSGIGTGADSEVTDLHDDRPDAIDRAARGLSDVELLAPPGDTYEYVSANYLLLGALVEEVTGRDFADLLRDRVFEPLDMKSAVSDATTAKTLPPGYRQYFGHSVTYDDPFDTSGVPYGYLGGSLRDLARFTLAELNGGTLDGERVLSAESIAASHRGHAKTSNGEFGYGWSVGRLAGTGETMVWKAGATPGFHTMVVLLPDRDRAVVVLQNAYSEARALQLRNAAFDAARLAIGEDRRPPAGPSYDLLAMPWIAVAAIVLFGLLWWATWYRLNRRRPRSKARLRLAAWLGAGVIVPVAALLALPGWLGVSLSRMVLWAPDLTYALFVLSAIVPLAAVWRVWIARRPT